MPTGTDALAGLPRRLWCANEQRAQRLLAQAVVSMERRIASGEGVEARCAQGFSWGLHAARGALSGTAGRQAAQEAGLALNLPSQQCAASGGDVAAMEAGHDGACAPGWEGARRFATLWQRKGGLLQG